MKPLDSRVTEMKYNLHDIFVELDAEEQRKKERQSSVKSLKTRRAIEDYYERKRLQQAVDFYDSDD